MKPVTPLGFQMLQLLQLYMQRVMRPYQLSEVFTSFAAHAVPSEGSCRSTGPGWRAILGKRRVEYVVPVQVSHGVCIITTICRDVHAVPCQFLDLTRALHCDGACAETLHRL